MIRHSIVLLAALTFALSAFADDSADSSSTIGGKSGAVSAKSKPSFEGKMAQIQDINAQPSKFSGKKVTVEGQITKVGEDSQSFVLDGQGLLNDQILVIGSKPLAAASSTSSNATNASNDTTAVSGGSLINPSQNVRVTGTIHRLTANQAKSRFGDRLDPDFASQWKGTMPVLVVNDATMVQRSDDALSTSYSSSARSNGAKDMKDMSDSSKGRSARSKTTTYESDSGSIHSSESNSGSNP